MVTAIEIEKLRPEKEEKTKSTKKIRTKEEKCQDCGCVIFIAIFIFIVIGLPIIGVITSPKRREVIDEVDKLHEEIAELKSDNAKEMKAIEELKLVNAKDSKAFRTEMQELKSDLRAVFGKLVEVPRKENTTRIVFEVPEIKSIRKDIEGSWKLVDHMNYEGYQKAHDSLNFEKFSENLRFDTLPDGRLVQTGGGSEQLIEDSSKKSEFYEEGNHLKSYWSLASTADRFVQEGKLIRIDFFEGGVAKREYQKI